LHREVMCAVLDAGDTAAVLKPLAAAEDQARSLHVVDELSDVWGWNPGARPRQGGLGGPLLFVSA
jgi:hypothetical protein